MNNDWNQQPPNFDILHNLRREFRESIAREKEKEEFHRIMRQNSKRWWEFWK